QSILPCLSASPILFRSVNTQWRFISMAKRVAGPIQAPDGSGFYNLNAEYSCKAIITCTPVKTCKETKKDMIDNLYKIWGYIIAPNVFLLFLLIIQPEKIIMNEYKLRNRLKSRRYFSYSGIGLIFLFVALAGCKGRSTSVKEDNNVVNDTSLH